MGIYINKKTVIAILATCSLLGGGLVNNVQGQINFPVSERLNEGWLHLRGDIGNIWEAVRPVTEGGPETVPVWTEVTLPHCFNESDCVDPFTNYYQGPGWYKTVLSLQNPYPGGRIKLHFEGAGQKTEVWVYMSRVGSHVGGYDEWTVDITDAVAEFLSSEDAERFGGKVPLSIRCDNSRDAEMIPSDLSDFNVYGGLYRYLNLVYTPSMELESLFTEAVVGKAGLVGHLNVNATLLDHTGNMSGAVTVRVFGPDGKNVAEEEIQIGSGELRSRLNSNRNKPLTNSVNSSEPLRETLDLLTVGIENPALWSPVKPNLYTCTVTINSGGIETTYSEKFGFRHFEFVKHGPFILNGERLLLRGTHRHEDHAGVAAAMTEEQIRAEMRLMKDMGVNFIRLGHYQQSRIVLQACDELGILVWEEIPWCRGGLGGPVYRDQARRMLTDMILQHRNHPSVILWGLGNENDWPNDFPHFDKEEIRTFMTELHYLSHTLDNTRLTCIRRCDFCKDIVDVYSPSIWAGWYRGIYTDYKRVSQAEMKKVNHFLHVEWGGDSHAGRFAENPYIGLDEIVPGEADERGNDASLYGGTARASRDGDWSESYICDLIDWHLKEQLTMDWLTGTAYWPFKDFSTPLRPENPVPYVNQKGVVERDLTPKESFYVFQSYWTESPMIRIFGHGWAERWGTDGEVKTVKIYSNCEEAELFVNGESLGRRTRNPQDFPAAGLRWETEFRSGENTLRAVGFNGGEKVEDQITFLYETRQWSAPAQISVTAVQDDAGDFWIEAVLQDTNGVTCLDSRSYFTFAAAGDGLLHDNLGTSSGSRYVQAMNGRAKIKISPRGGTTVVSVSSEGIPTAFVTVK